jgi:hypothetical protein
MMAYNITSDGNNFLLQEHDPLGGVHALLDAPNDASSDVSNDASSNVSTDVLAVSHSIFQYIAGGNGLPTGSQPF